MNPETPILMITLQIPVTPDTTADEVLDAIGRQVSDALQDFRSQQSSPDPEIDEVDAQEREEFKASVPNEKQEHFSDLTREDLLAQMGYRSRK
jgi:hypothetical protein